MVLCICFDVSDSFFACREACFPARSRHLLIFVKRLAIQGYGIYLQMRGLYRKVSCRKIGVHAMFLATSAILHCKYKFCAFFQALSPVEICPQIPNNPGITSKAGNSGPLEASRSASIMIPRIPDNSENQYPVPESFMHAFLSAPEATVETRPIGLPGIKFEKNEVYKGRTGFSPSSLNSFLHVFSIPYVARAGWVEVHRPRLPACATRNTNTRARYDGIRSIPSILGPGMGLGMGTWSTGDAQLKPARTHKGVGETS